MDLRQEDTTSVFNLRCLVFFFTDVSIAQSAGATCRLV
eukprot:CAMPEP_0179429746 /NCGR_PEP_ID=MMETSP0799-20121207/15040_1 /TAXON_ID=46947 /ORGANISM="Geminigera cryophila, Strain CCMP2564" /LENGTH=37 /DNA_ID= /DNA_START= /DNA_END= /DNA_ORIENTATION=